MPQIICHLPNASKLINGVRFLEHELGVISEEISDDAAKAFTAIRGYTLVAKPDQAAADAKAAADKAVADAAAADAAAAAEAEKATLIARAVAIEFSVKSNWGLDRLRAEVEKAEKTAADAKAAADSK